MTQSIPSITVAIVVAPLAPATLTGTRPAPGASPLYRPPEVAPSPAIRPATKVPCPYWSLSGLPPPVRSTPDSSLPAKSGSGSMPVSTTATLTPEPESPLAQSWVAPVCCGNMAAGAAPLMVACASVDVILTVALAVTVTVGIARSSSTCTGFRSARTALAAVRSVTTWPPRARTSLTACESPGAALSDTMYSAVLAGSPTAVPAVNPNPATSIAETTTAFRPMPRRRPDARPMSLSWGEKIEGMGSPLAPPGPGDQLEPGFQRTPSPTGRHDGQLRPCCQAFEGTLSTGFRFRKKELMKTDISALGPVEPPAPLSADGSPTGAGSWRSRPAGSGWCHRRSA